jgi:hypothetical protein
VQVKRRQLAVQRGVLPVVTVGAGRYSKESNVVNHTQAFEELAAVAQLQVGGEVQGKGRCCGRALLCAVLCCAG